MREKSWLGLPGGRPETRAKEGVGGPLRELRCRTGGVDREAGRRPAAQSEPGGAWEPTGPAQRLGGS